MAYTEIHPVKSTLDKALAYICNPEKTDEKLLIYGGYVMIKKLTPELQHNKHPPGKGC